VAPGHARSQRPPIWVGGFSKAAARRAARYGDGYIGPLNRGMYETYLSEVKAAGKDPARARVIGGDLWLIVSEDPRRTFVECPPNLLYLFNAYSPWFEGSGTGPWPHLDNKEQILCLWLAPIFTPHDP